jgi:cysteine desulfurase
MSELGLAALTITAHKLHGPVGIGALITRPDIVLEPMVVGGGQQLGWRAGTEPVIPAVAFATALGEIDAARRGGVYDQVLRLREHFERHMLAIGDTSIIAADTNRLPHTSNVAFHGLERQALQMALDLAGLACSAGSACSSGSSRPSPILLAMGLPDAIVGSSLRFSFSKSTSLQEIDSAIEIIQSVVARLRDRKTNQSALSQ